MLLDICKQLIADTYTEHGIKVDNIVVEVERWHNPDLHHLPPGDYLLDSAIMINGSFNPKGEIDVKANSNPIVLLRHRVVISG